MSDSTPPTSAAYSFWKVLLVGAIYAKFPRSKVCRKAAVAKAFASQAHKLLLLFGLTLPSRPWSPQLGTTIFSIPAFKGNPSLGFCPHVITMASIADACCRLDLLQRPQGANARSSAEHSSWLQGTYMPAPALVRQEYPEQQQDRVACCQPLILTNR
ncbi:hypothetical protein CLAIMM_14192 [Cladophialophora immunda]|nr:hypothetical protein CLAIMM_14192 [Cladophialophora immunda]